jgi:hypothetical protein
MQLYVLDGKGKASREAVVGKEVVVSGKGENKKRRTK